MWDGNRYRDVDLGCLNVDERATLQRTLRTDASHQPFGHDAHAAQPDLASDTSRWYDASTHAHPKAITQGVDVGTDLPFYRGVVWISSLPSPAEPLEALQDLGLI